MFACELEPVVIAFWIASMVLSMVCVRDPERAERPGPPLVFCPRIAPAPAPIAKSPSRSIFVGAPRLRMPPRSDDPPPRPRVVPREALPLFIMVSVKRRSMLWKTVGGERRKVKG
jgi:hypothetical protein